FEVKNLSVSPQTAGRVLDRVRLLDCFDRLPATLDRGGTMGAIEAHQRRALTLLTTDAARRAFDLSREPARLRERYGMHAWGQRALLARRLVEAGATFVTMVMENPMPAGTPLPADVTYNWDSHAVNCHIFKDTRVRLPVLDQAVTALIED